MFRQRFRSMLVVRDGATPFRGARFFVETQASTAVEFALIGFPLLGTILFSMALGLMYLSSTSLDFAVQKAARSIMTGAVQSGQIGAAQYQTTTFCPSLLTFFDCTKVIINVKVERQSAQTAATTGYSDLVNSSQTALLLTAYTTPGSATFCTGQAGDYVYIQVIYPLPAAVGFLSPSSSLATVNGRPAFLLNSTLAFKNEQISANSGC